MSLSEAVIEGTIQPDGTLVLDENLNLPAGRVQVIIQALPEIPKDHPFWQRMQKMWDIPALSPSDTESELSRMQEEWEEHQEALEQIQEQC